MTQDNCFILPFPYPNLKGKLRVTLADFLLHYVFSSNVSGKVLCLGLRLKNPSNYQYYVYK